MRRLFAVAMVGLLVLVLTGCGDDDETTTESRGSSTATTTGDMEDMPGMTMHDGHDHAGEAKCEPSGTSLSIVASGTKFDKDCLAAPADRPFTVNFDNKDQTVHNLMILESHSASEALFDAGTIPNGIRTLNVPALKAGTFAFHCKIHPGAMSGTFVVK